MRRVILFSGTALVIISAIALYGWSTPLKTDDTATSVASSEVDNTAEPVALKDEDDASELAPFTESCSYRADVKGFGFADYRALINGRAFQQQTLFKDEYVGFDYGFDLPLVEPGKNILEVDFTRLDNIPPDVGRKVKVTVTISRKCWPNSEETPDATARISAVATATIGELDGNSSVVLPFNARLSYKRMTLASGALDFITELLRDTYPVGAPVNPLPFASINETQWVNEHFGPDALYPIAGELIYSAAFLPDGTVERSTFDNLHSMRFLFPGYDTRDTIAIMYSSPTGSLRDIVPLIETKNGDKIYAISLIEEGETRFKIVGLHEPNLFQ